MKRGPIVYLLFAAVLAVEAILAMHMLSSSSVIGEDEDISKRRLSTVEFDSTANNMLSSVLSDIYDIPKAYVLPLVDEAMPEPDSNGYSVVTDSEIHPMDGTSVLRYEDETTVVTLWKEYISGSGFESVFNFAEIKIDHPTQLRRHLAGWEYGDRCKTPTALSKEVNAVVALSGDYYCFRRNGIVVQNGQLYRNAPADTMNDVLFVDAHGNLLIEHCTSAFDTEAYLAANDIMFSMSFGPTLVKDGVAITDDDMLSYKGEGGARYLNPRAAIGQIGELHYLFCTVDGRTSVSNGATCVNLAEVMADKGCVTAYNLDGGASATLVYQDEVFNRTPSGNQRSIADIIFIATANPDSE